VAVGIQTTPIAELAWLAEVQPSGPHLTPFAPVWVKRFAVEAGPAILHPECHAYCELGMHTQGSGTEFVGREQATREAGDLFIAGPGVPHWFEPTRYPLEGVVVYFLPIVLCEVGPKQDGIQILRRFTAGQSLAERLLRPPAELRERMQQRFTDIVHEFATESLGREIRLRTLLMDMLVDLVRWEQQSGAVVALSSGSPRWQDVNQALHYLREHFSQRVYARDVARAAGVSESQLKVIFRETLGIPWSRYIQGYRIQQAVAMLSASQCNVTKAALAAGFESLSHFNATFRAFMGVSPSAYLKKMSDSARI
jgi:AraC-like DNA-binding protein